MTTNEVKAIVRSAVQRQTRAGKTYLEVLLEEQSPEGEGNLITTTWWGDRFGTDAEEGDVVAVTLFVNGREYNGKYYVQLSGKSCKVLKKAEGICDELLKQSPDDEMPF